ncbi:hypothetical protein HMI55_005078 [Coelomomyces lativittatus]|nr:hypothetical protein HMI55_005078 [Coelomomyces lativittatus]
MNTRVDSQAHRFLLDPPHPDELITSEVTLPTLSMPSTSHPIPQPSPHIRSTSTEITSNSVSYLSSPPRSNMEIVDDWADIDWSETNLTHLIDPGPPKLSLQELVTTPFVIVQVMARISKTGTKVFRHPETHALSIVVTLEDATGKEVVRFDTSKYKDILSQNPRDPQFMIQLKSILKQHVHDSVLCLEKINGQWTWV